MKRVLSLVWMSLSSLAFAEDYYVPIKKELEPSARLPMPDYTMTDDRLEYVLPKDIAGRDLSVSLARIQPISPDLPRLYQGPLATVACMGSNQLPACVVTHKDLRINPKEVEGFLASKYRDPKKLADAIAVAANFSAGNEPIGFMSKRTILPPKEMPAQWTLRSLQTDSQSAARQEFVGQLNLKTRELKIQGMPLVLKLSEVHEDGLHFSARIDGLGQSRWIDILVSTDKTSFEGTWGLIQNGGQSLQASGILRAQSLVP